MTANWSWLIGYSQTAMTLPSASLLSTWR